MELLLGGQKIAVSEARRFCPEAQQTREQRFPRGARRFRSPSPNETPPRTKPDALTASRREPEAVLSRRRPLPPWAPRSPSAGFGKVHPHVCLGLAGDRLGPRCGPATPGALLASRDSSLLGPPSVLPLQPGCRVPPTSGPCGLETGHTDSGPVPVSPAAAPQHRVLLPLKAVPADHRARCLT